MTINTTKHVIPGQKSLDAFGQKLGSDAYDILKDFLKGVVQKGKIELEIGFTNYVQSAFKNLNSVKTIINRYQPVPLIEIYEDNFLSLKDENDPNNKIFESELDLLCEPTCNMVITGIAGSGKSFLLKRAFLRHCEINYGYLPIYIELRMLTGSNSKSFIDLCISSLESTLDFVDLAMFKKLCKNHKVILFVDGFDELLSTDKDTISREMLNFSTKFLQSKFIVTSRPDERFSSWHNFHEYVIRPMSKKQCLSLINKAKHPSDLKDKFAKIVDNSLYHTHQDYLKNPLLTYVMLYTSDQFTEFPEHISDFYEKAFEMLYRGHDVMKSGEYVREVKCQMKQRDLEAIFAYFCALAFRAEKYEYDVEYLRHTLNGSIKIYNKSFDVDDLIYDIEKNYCLLIRDGGIYNYIHRSLQEYFAAKCLSNTEIIDYYDYNKLLIESGMDTSRYFSILKEIGKEKFEKRFLEIHLNELIIDLDPLCKKKPQEFLLNITLQIECNADGRVISHTVRENNIRSKWNHLDKLLISTETYTDSDKFKFEDVEFLKSLPHTKLNNGEIRVDIRKISDRNVTKLNTYKWSMETYIELRKKNEEMKKTFVNRVKIAEDKFV